MASLGGSGLEPGIGCCAEGMFSSWTVHAPCAWLVQGRETRRSKEHTALELSESRRSGSLCARK
jgi:hypothetical protein